MNPQVNEGFAPSYPQGWREVAPEVWTRWTTLWTNYTDVVSNVTSLLSTLSPTPCGIRVRHAVLPDVAADLGSVRSHALWTRSRRWALRCDPSSWASSLEPFAGTGDAACARTGWLFHQPHCGSGAVRMVPGGLAVALRTTNSRRHLACELVKARDRSPGPRGAASTPVAVDVSTSALQGRHREAHIPTEPAPPVPQARLPQPHVGPCRTGHRQVPPAQGKAQAVRLIAPVRGHSSFAELRRRGHRARAGALRITHLADATPVPRLAFAIPRQVGNAVARNRVRRQMRVIFAEVAATEPDLVGPGDYLLSIRRVDVARDEARAWLIKALRDLRARTATT